MRGYGIVDQRLYPSFSEMLPKGIPRPAAHDEEVPNGRDPHRREGKA